VSTFCLLLCAVTFLFYILWKCCLFIFIVFSALVSFKPVQLCFCRRRQLIIYDKLVIFYFHIKWKEVAVPMEQKPEALETIGKNNTMQKVAASRIWCRTCCCGVIRRGKQEKLKTSILPELRLKAWKKEREWIKCKYKKNCEASLLWFTQQR
jgi:hypothetical protein